MSWDLYVLPLQPGDDPWEALDRLEEAEAGPRDPAIEGQKRELADALCAAWPELEEFPLEHEDIARELGLTLEEAHEQYRYIELNPRSEDGLPIQPTVCDTFVTFNIPYWDLGARNAELVERLTSLVAVVVEHTGWSIVDPQAERVITIDELPECFAAEHADGVQHVNAWVASQGQPRRKHLFGLL